MRGPTVVRFAMVVLFVSVLAAIVLMWRSDDPEVMPEEVATRVAEPGVVSRSSGLSFTAESNGVRQYELRAGRGVEFEGNRSEYQDDVALDLYGVPVGEERVQEITAVTAQRLEVVRRQIPIEGDPYESVQLLDDVRAVLPKGQEFSSDAINYGDRRLSTNRGVRLTAGGIVVESREMTYDPDASLAELSGPHPESLRGVLPGPVKLWTEGDESAVAPSLAGNARTLSYEVDASLLRLLGAPEVFLPEAAIRGAEITLELDDGANTITKVVARGNATVVWTPEEGGAYEATAEIVEIPLLDSRPQGMIVVTEEPELPRPAFELEDGSLRADRIEVDSAQEAGQSVRATGNAYFLPQAGSGLQHIAADRLSVGPDSFEDLQADGTVEILLPAGQGEGARFTGSRARVRFRDGEIVDAEWPVGLTYRDPTEGVEVTGGYGVLEPETGDWILGQAAPNAPLPGSSMPRPRFESPDFDVTADSIRMGATGAMGLTGAVDARLRGEAIRTVGPLFGDAAEVIAGADELQVDADGRRLEFTGRARVFREGGDQLLQAEEITIMPERNELEANGSVFVSLIDPADPDAGRPEARTIVLTGGRLLVEGEPLRLVVADEALLELNQAGRTIGGGRLVVAIDAQGAWRDLEVYDGVVLTDPAGRGEGARLEYDADAEVVIIHAAESGQATFIPNQGIDIRDRQGLRLTWLEGGLEVIAMQNGTTQIVRGGGR